MKWTIVLLISSFSIYFSWGATCRNDVANCSQPGGNTSACKMNGPQACWVKSDQGVCRRILNSTGSAQFVPAKTTVELNTAPGAGSTPGTTFCN